MRRPPRRVRFPPGTPPLPKPNYSFEKRQRELAKKKKNDEKAARKRDARAEKTPGTPEPASDADRPARPD